MNGNSREEDVNKQDKEMFQLYEKGLPLLIQGLTDIHLLSEYGDTLLAGTWSGAGAESGTGTGGWIWNIARYMQ